MVRRVGGDCGGAPRERPIDLSKPITLSAYGEYTKKAGFYELSNGQMKELVVFLHSDRTKGKPTLWLAPEDVASTLEVAKRLRTTAENLQVNDLFTNEFLPKQ